MIGLRNRRGDAMHHACIAAYLAACHVADQALAQEQDTDCEPIHWPTAYRTPLNSTFRFVDFLAPAGPNNTSGEILARWAVGRGLLELDVDRWAELPASIRLPFSVFVSSFHEINAHLQHEVTKHEEAERAARQAPVQRVRVTETIFEKGDEDGPFVHMGPAGQVAPRPVPQAEALSVAPAAGQADAPDPGAALRPEGSPAQPAGQAPADPLTVPPAGDDDQASREASEPSLGVSSLNTAGAGTSQPAPALSAPRKGKRSS